MITSRSAFAGIAETTGQPEIEAVHHDIDEHAKAMMNAQSVGDVGGGIHWQHPFHGRRDAGGARGHVAARVPVRRGCGGCAISRKI